MVKRAHMKESITGRTSSGGLHLWNGKYHERAWSSAEVWLDFYIFGRKCELCLPVQNSPPWCKSDLNGCQSITRLLLGCSGQFTALLWGCQWAYMWLLICPGQLSNPCVITDTHMTRLGMCVPPVSSSSKSKLIGSWASSNLFELLFTRFDML